MSSNNNRTILIGLANLLAIFVVVGVISQGFSAQEAGRHLSTTTSEEVVSFINESNIQLDAPRRELRFHKTTGSSSMMSMSMSMSKKSSSVDCVSLSETSSSTMKSSMMKGSSSTMSPAPVSYRGFYSESAKETFRLSLICHSSQRISRSFARKLPLPRPPPPLRLPFRPLHPFRPLLHARAPPPLAASPRCPCLRCPNPPCPHR